MNVLPNILFGSLLCLNSILALATPAMAAQEKRDYLAEMAKIEKPPMMHHRVAKPILVPLDDSATAVLWKPDLSTLPLTITSGEIKLPKTGVDNYHVVVAEQQINNLKKTFIRYIYRHGKPSGHSTSKVVLANKAELEIIPDPVPREHNRYYSMQGWSFIVHFQGQPLSSHPVELKTENGSLLQQNTDNQGKVTFVLPDDFPNVTPGKRDKRSATMTISTQHQSGSQQWQTQLAADYAINESYWRSTNWGIITMIIGLISGGVFIRLNKAKNRD